MQAFVVPSALCGSAFVCFVARPGPSVDRKTALFKQRFYVGVAAPEASISLRTVCRVGFRKNDAAEPLRDRLVPRTARFEKPLPGIRGHHVGPEIAVVPS